MITWFKRNNPLDRLTTLYRKLYRVEKKNEVYYVHYFNGVMAQSFAPVFTLDEAKELIANHKLTNASVIVWEE